MKVDSLKKKSGNPHTELWLQEPMSQFMVHDYEGYGGWGRILVFWRRHYYTGKLEIIKVADLP